MQPVTRSLSATGDSGAVVMDIMAQPFNASVAVAIVGTSATYSVAYTLDDPNSFGSAALFLANATWFTHATLAAQTTNQFGNVAFPVKALKLTVSAIVAATVTMTVIQTGSGRV